MNNEFVSVPRELAQEAHDELTSWDSPAAATLRALLAHPAAQHQGEPVGWTYEDGKEYTACPDHAHDLRAEGIELTEVFTHADTGEVERLNDHLDAANRAIEHAATTKEAQQKTIGALMADAKQFRAERDALRAQLAERNAALECMTTTATSYKSELAERDALCKRLTYHLGPALAANQGSMSPECIHDAHAAIHEWTQIALSASAEPSAPVERDERAEFEVAMREERMPLRRHKDGYFYGATDRKWSLWQKAWQARAALERNHG